MLKRKASTQLTSKPKAKEGKASTTRAKRKERQLSPVKREMQNLFGDMAQDSICETFIFTVDSIKEYDAMILVLRELYKDNATPIAKIKSCLNRLFIEQNVTEPSEIAQINRISGERGLAHFRKLYREFKIPNRTKMLRLLRDYLLESMAAGKIPRVQVVTRPTVRVFDGIAYNTAFDMVVYDENYLEIEFPGFRENAEDDADLTISMYSPLVTIDYIYDPRGDRVTTFPANLLDEVHADKDLTVSYYKDEVKELFENWISSDFPLILFHIYDGPKKISFIADDYKDDLEIWSQESVTRLQNLVNSIKTV